MMQSLSLVFLSCCNLHLWWLISGVKLTWPWCLERWSNSILDISVRVFHWVGPMFKSVNFESSRLPFIIWVGLIQAVKDLNRTKTNLPLCQQKKEFYHQMAFGLKIQHWFFLGLQSDSSFCRLWTCQPLWPERGFPGGSEVKASACSCFCLPARRDTWVRSLGREDPLEKEMATHSSILAWQIPWMEEPGGLQSMGSQRVRHDWANNQRSLFLKTNPPTIASYIQTHILVVLFLWKTLTNTLIQPSFLWTEQSKTWEISVLLSVNSAPFLSCITEEILNWLYLMFECLHFQECKTTLKR